MAKVIVKLKIMPETPEVKLDEIKEYIISTGQKYTQKDYELCYELLKENKYLTSKLLEQHPVFSIKYINPNDIKRLMDGMFKHFDDLKEEKTGTGGKRYIFKKEDENEVKKLIQQKTKTERKTIKETDINEIKNLECTN